MVSFGHPDPRTDLLPYPKVFPPYSPNFRAPDPKIHKAKFVKMKIE